MESAVDRYAERELEQAIGHLVGRHLYTPDEAVESLNEAIRARIETLKQRAPARGAP